MADPTITEDAAARLIDLAPGELAALANRGVIPRVGRNAYALVPVVHGYINHLREEQIRLDKRPTQPEIAAHLDISDRRLRELLAEWSIDHKQSSLSEIRIRYIRKLREEAAGRATDGDLDLATQRARLAKEQADRIEMQNAVTRKDLASTELLQILLANAGVKVGRILDAIPGLLRRRNDKLNSDDITMITHEIAKCRNLCAQINLDDLNVDDESEEPDPPHQEEIIA